MNMRGDNKVKRRGKYNLDRKPFEQRPNTDGPRLVDFTWPHKEDRPRNLIAFNEPKGQWTYPKEGFIQWKMPKRNT